MNISIQNRVCVCVLSRLSRIWKEELEKHGPENAKFVRAVWRFNRFPMILAAILMITACVLAYVGPVRRGCLFCDDIEFHNESNHH